MKRWLSPDDDRVVVADTKREAAELAGISLAALDTRWRVILANLGIPSKKPEKGFYRLVDERWVREETQEDLFANAAAQTADIGKAWAERAAGATETVRMLSAPSWRFTAIDAYVLVPRPIGRPQALTEGQQRQLAALINQAAKKRWDELVDQAMGEDQP